MRSAFAVALALSLASFGMASRQQDAAGSANTTPQAPPNQPAPAEQAPTAPPDTSTERKARADDTQQQTTEHDSKGNAEPDSATTDPTKTNPPNGNSARPDSFKAGSSGAGASSPEIRSPETRSGAAKRSSRTPSSPTGTPRKTVVRQGGAKEPAMQIAPGMTPAEAARERQNAEQWLRATVDRLPQLGALTDARQQETVGQIRNYMDGARSALKEGDVRRASTLAEKAHLLAEDLLRR